MQLLKSRSTNIIVALAFTLLAIASYSLSTGEIDIALSDVFNSLLSRSSQYNNLVIQQIRVPRILAGIFIGATLSASGLLTNISMKNPLADSSILGIQSGATVGALIALLIVPTLVGLLPVFAFIGGLLAFSIIAITSSLKKNFQPQKVVLVGVAINSVSTSLIGVFTILYAERIKNALSWLNGSLVNISQTDLLTIVIYSTIIIALVFFLLPLAKILLLDDTAIINIGYNPKVLRMILSLVAVLLASISVSFAGIISFVGIIAPQIARRLVKDNDLKLRLIASMLVGSLLVVSADLIQRLIFSPTEIPVGVLIGLVGAPIFILLAGDDKHATH